MLGQVKVQFVTDVEFSATEGEIFRLKLVAWVIL
jgi:hypothetical protein